jgi:hypothetical protein
MNSRQLLMASRAAHRGQSENEEESQSQSETEEESQEESQEEIAGLRHSNDKPSSFSGSGVRPLPLSILTLTSQERAR